MDLLTLFGDLPFLDLIGLGKTVGILANESSNRVLTTKKKKKGTHCIDYTSIAFLDCLGPVFAFRQKEKKVWYAWLCFVVGFYLRAFNISDAFEASSFSPFSNPSAKSTSPQQPSSI